ncbi:hypothetical protein AB7M17_000946 [Bradyrhizobium sp. USDA 377]
MPTRKMLMFTGLLLIAFPLPRAELLSRTAEDCKCDLNELGCRIMCSGIGSGRGTGGGSSTFDVAPGANRQLPERPIVVPRTETDIRNPSGPNK